MNEQAFRLSQLDWGRDDAESDAELDHYFVDPDGFNRILNGSKQIIVGRKGTGKTAIAKRLKAAFAAADHTLVCELNPGQGLSSQIGTWLDDQQANYIVLKHAWLLYIATKVFASIGAMDSGKLKHKSFARAREFARQRGFAPSSDIATAGKRVLHVALAAVNQSGQIPVDVERHIRDELEWDAFEVHLRQLTAEGLSIKVLLDDLDQGWYDATRMNELLIGLTLARAQLQQIAPARIDCYLFIRDDVYRLVQKDNPHSDKLRDRYELTWDDRRLQAMLEQRIRFGFRKLGRELPTAPWDAVFPEKVGPTYTVRWMIERSFRRPRDLIQMARLYTESNLSDQPDPQALKAIEEQYSRDKLEDLCNEHRYEYPQLIRLFETWFRRVDWVQARLELAMLTELLGRLVAHVDCEESWCTAGKQDPVQLARVLYRVGIIGTGSGKDVVYRDFFAEPDLTVIQFHPCFHRVLNVVKSKSKKGSDKGWRLKHEGG